MMPEPGESAREGCYLAVGELGHPASLGRRRSQVQILPARQKVRHAVETASCADSLGRVMLSLLHRTAIFAKAVDNADF